MFEAKFVPGLYLVQEFSVTADGDPIEKTVKTREYCIKPSEVSMIARAPYLVGLMETTCGDAHAELTDDVLVAQAQCMKGKRPVVRMALVGVAEDGKQIVSFVQHFTPPKKKGAKGSMIYGVGSHMTWKAECP